MNLQKFKGKLRECGVTYAECAKLIGVSPTSFCQKMNGKSKFYIDDLDKIGNYLGLTREQKGDIFL